MSEKTKKTIPPAEIYIRPHDIPVAVAKDGDLQVYFNGQWVLFKHELVSPDLTSVMVPILNIARYRIFAM